VLYPNVLISSKPLPCPVDAYLNRKEALEFYDVATADASMDVDLAIIVTSLFAGSVAKLSTPQPASFCSTLSNKVMGAHHGSLVDR